jgi:hypothetical protein
MNNLIPILLTCNLIVLELVYLLLLNIEENREVQGDNNENK